MSYLIKYFRSVLPKSGILLPFGKTLRNTYSVFRSEFSLINLKGLGLKLNYNYSTDKISMYALSPVKKKYTGLEESIISHVTLAVSVYSTPSYPANT